MMYVILLGKGGLVVFDYEDEYTRICRQSKFDSDSLPTQEDLDELRQADTVYRLITDYDNNGHFYPRNS